MYKFSIKIVQFPIYRWHLARKSDHQEVSGNRNGKATTYFFEWQWFTYLSSLYTPATSEAITNWVRYSTNAILRLASTLLSFSTSKAKRCNPTEIFSVEKRILLCMKDWCSDRPIRLHFILKLLSQRFLMGGVPSFICNLRDKVQIFWEGHKVWKRIQ